MPEDPAVKEMLSHKPAYGAVTTPKADANGNDGEIYDLQPTSRIHQLQRHLSRCLGHLSPKGRLYNLASRQALLSLSASAAKPRQCWTSEE